MNTMQSIMTAFSRAYVVCMAVLVLLLQARGIDAAEGAQAPGDAEMETRVTVQHYFEALERQGAWQHAFADDMVFTSFTSPVKQVSSKAAYLEATKRFYGSIRRAQLLKLLVDGDRACALTRYELQPPNGAPAFTSDVAELFTVRDGKIQALAIYFDSAPFPK